MSDLDKTLKLWRERSKATWRQPIPAPPIQGHASEASRAAIEHTLVSMPQLGDDAGVTCPHCETPMIVVNIIHASLVIECPECRKKP